AYAEGAGVYVDDLIDDAVDLPEALPAVQHVTGTRAKPPTKRLRAHINTTVVTLLLKIENDSNRWRGDNRARRGIEKSHLSQREMKKVGDNEYELVFSYEDEADLDEQIYALLRTIKNEAKRNNCSVKIAAREKGADRYW